jgi:leader peptidase (prepilin peptidase)/N-methyltransferase
MIVLLVYCALALIASIIDIKYYKIPDLLTFPGIIILVILVFFLERSFIFESLLASVICFAFLFTLSVLTKGMGFGDVKFGILTGFVCGFQGSFIALLVASLAGLLFAVTLLFLKKINRTTRIPFAPFLLIGTISAKILIMLYPHLLF